MTQEAAVSRRQQHDERREVLDVLAEWQDYGACSTTFIASRLGWTNERTRRVCWSLATHGRLHTDGNASTRWWRLP